ncbi:hypothetical protein V8G54_007492 [Vigna mungo]|uniref:DUF8039 domain-containing protein n=1 Tax=Vigna mungo TaxID=3915 RepID=A0AAQ3P3E3_VIGMU
MQVGPKHNVVHPDQMNPRSTKDSCVVEDEDEDIETDISYRCKLFVKDVPWVVAIGRVYPRGSTMHTMSMLNDLVKVVVEEIRNASAPLIMPSMEVQVVGDTLGTFISWPKDLIKSFSTKKVFCFSQLHYYISFNKTSYFKFVSMFCKSL